jgi:transposase
MEACVGAHHLARKLNCLGHHARLMPARYVRAYAMIDSFCTPFASIWKH